MRSQLPGGSAATRQSTGYRPAAPAFPVESTSLSKLIHLLSGDDAIYIADIGITPLDHERLDAIAGNAIQQSESSLDCAQLLLSLMETILENECPPDNHSLSSLARHIARLLRDQQRWHTLADNAAYYRDHPKVAARIADARNA